MKKVFIPTAFIILFVAFSQPVCSQEDPSDAVYEQVIKEYTLQPDGSWNYHFSQKLRLLTYYSFHTLYGEDFIVYDPTYQSIKINRSNTIMADGKLVKGPDNSFNEVLPGFAANAPAFNALREMVVTHTGLERGALIDFDYTLSSKKGYTAFLSGNEPLMMNSPVKELKFILHIPKTASIHFNTYNIDDKPVVTKSSTEITYTWTLNNLPAASREEFRPRDQHNRPRVVFSTAKNCEEVIRKFVSQPAFALPAGDVLSGRVRELIREKNDDAARMMALQDFVVSEFNYYPVPTSINGFRVRTADEVFQSNGGNEIEKAVLLASILKSAGFQAEPVAVFPETLFRAGSANLMLVEKFLVMVTSRSMDLPGPVFLSPLQNSTYNEAWALHGKKVLSLLSSEPGKVVNFNSTDHSAELSGAFEMTLDRQLKGKVQGTFEGRFNPWFKLRQDSSYCKKMLAGQFEGKEVKEGKIEDFRSDRTQVYFSISSTEKVREQAGHYFLTIPTLSSGIDGWHMTELVTNRKEPLEIPFPVKESYRYSITLPDGYELITPEIREKISRSFGEFQVDITQEGKTLQVDRKISLKGGIITPPEYSDFKAFINAWNTIKFKEYIIRKGPK